jgi:hypothetical protein
MAPTQICLTDEQDKFRKNLTQLCKTKLKTYDPNNEEEESIDGCVIC